MIFVTVGTTHFDELVETVDKLAEKLKEKCTIQIGVGKYIPKNCKWFRFKSSLKNYYKNSDLFLVKFFSLHKKLLSSLCVFPRPKVL